MKIRIKRVVLGVIAGIALIGAIAVIVWLATPYRASSDALALLKDSDSYNFINEGNLEFIPKEPKDSGLIIYPGGRVEAAAYSYLCTGVAKEGYPCIIAIMPLNLAVTKVNSAGEIISKYSKVTKWVLGGHSLGGSMVIRYLQNSPDKIKGLLMLGSYSDIDLSYMTLSSKNLIGSEDFILNANTFTSTYKNLPKGASIILIQGGNHSLFGDYGLQEGDGDPKISKEEQHKIVVDAAISLLSE